MNTQGLPRVGQHTRSEWALELVCEPEHLSSTMPKWSTSWCPCEEWVQSSVESTQSSACHLAGARCLGFHHHQVFYKRASPWPLILRAPFFPSASHCSTTTSSSLNKPLGFSALAFQPSQIFQPREGNSSLEHCGSQHPLWFLLSTRQRLTFFSGSPTGVWLLEGRHLSLSPYPAMSWDEQCFNNGGEVNDHRHVFVVAMS